jgi:AraC-like DNA-binding protein
MQPVIDISSLIYLVTVILCFVAGAVLLVHSKSRAVNNRWLAAYYLFIGYGLLVAFLLYSRLITNFPWYHTYRTGYISGLLLMPLSFFYIRSLIEQKKFKPVDLLHFLPAIIFIIDFIPFYLRPAEYKIQQLAFDGMDSAWSEFSQSWLGIGFAYVPFRIASTAIYWIIQVRMISQSKMLNGGWQLVAENRETINWAKILCGSQVLFFLPYLLSLSGGSRETQFTAAHTSLAVGVSITLLILVMKPNILYGLKGIVVNNFLEELNNDTRKRLDGLAEKLMDIHQLSKDNADRNSVNDAQPKSGNIYLSGQKLNEIGNRLTDHLVTNRTYLRKGCTIADLAAELTMQPYVLAAIIHQVYKINFSDFINGYRVQHAKNLIENGETKQLTLEGLSEQCGFNNRNTFTMAFKKHMGQTPSDFIKEIAQH